MKIAILEDDEILSSEINVLIQEHGHEAKVFSNGQALVRELGRNPFDMYILDWHVPKLNGFDLLIHMRQTLKIASPIIFLSSETRESEMVKALENGADDYCCKPVRWKEFTARIKKLEQRIKPQDKQLPEGSQSIAGYTFNKSQLSVSFKGKTVQLRDKEFSLAHLLFVELGQPLSRNKILLAIWGATTDELSRTLDVHITRVRKNLDLNYSNNELRLVSIYGFGYRLTQIYADD